MQPVHELQNVEEVLKLVAKHPKGLVLAQIKDAYKGVADDVKVQPQSAFCLHAQLLSEHRQQTKYGITDNNGVWE